MRYVECTRWGDLFVHYFEGSFTGKLWASILSSKEHVSFVSKLKDQNRFEVFYHDGCMRGYKPVTELNKAFGEGHWYDSPPPPCREVIGTREVKVKASAKRKAHTRTIKVYRTKQKCFCHLPENAAPAKSPDLNVCENLFNDMTTRLAQRGLNEGWPRNKDELRERLDEVIHSIPKSWFRNAFDSLPARWEKCAKNFGKLTDFYCPKYT